MPVISQDLTDSIYRGTTEISAVYRGSKLIWERDTTPPEPVITYKYYFSIDNTGSVIMRGDAINDDYYETRAVTSYREIFTDGEYTGIELLPISIETTVVDKYDNFYTETFERYKGQGYTFNGYALNIHAEDINVGNPASVRMKITQNMTGENVTIFVSQLGLGDNRVKTEINMSAGYIYASIPNPAHSRLVLGFTISTWETGDFILEDVLVIEKGQTEANYNYGTRCDIQTDDYWSPQYDDAYVYDY